MNSFNAKCSVMKLEGRQLNGLILSCATGNKELWLMALNQTGLLLYLMLFSLRIDAITSVNESEKDSLLMTVFVTVRWRIQ